MKRVAWIDVAKGMGILLVVLAHSRFQSREMSWWINSFHMPLFFVVAGICYDETRYSNFFAYLRRKIVALVYPYFTLSLLAIGLVAVLYRGDDASWGVGQMVKNMLTGSTGGAFWFITALLIVELLYASFVKFVRNNYIRLVATFAVSLLAAYFIPRHLPYFIDTALAAIFFYAAGHFARPYVLSAIEVPRFRWYSAVVLALTWGLQIFLVCIVYRYKATFAARDLNNPAFYYFLASLGSIGLLACSSLLDGSAKDCPGYVGSLLRRFIACLRFLGRNTIVILAFHNMLGLCRSSWRMNGLLSQMLEFLILGVLLWLLSGPLHSLISIQRVRDKT